MFEKELQLLKTIQAPTNNIVTDNFGLNRDWGKNGWHPDCGYSPIHLGVDFSARPDGNIYMPCLGQIWGDFRPYPIGSYCLVIPNNMENISFIFMHCQPTGSIWKRFDKGDKITTHAGYGIGAPHLHFEILVTKSLGKYLLELNILKKIENIEGEIIKKSRNSNINEYVALSECRKQLTMFNILDVGQNYIVQKIVPDYKKSRHSLVGRDDTYLIDYNAIKLWQNT